MTHRTVLVAALALSVLAAGCPPRTRISSVPEAPLLRVGVTPDTPPIVFTRNGRLTGLEIDMAQQLARELGRRLRFVTLPWDEEIPALLDGRIDVVMSGMTITPARQVRIAFSEPYLKSGLMALMLRSSRDKYDSLPAVMGTSADVGVMRDTTAERFVREQIPKANPVTYLSSKDAIIDLKQTRIGLFIADAPVIVWLVSENEAELALLHTPLNEEQLGWGVRQGDLALKRAADTAIARWRSNGTLDQILKRWLPYWPDRDD
jgi:polar amino acid transport system substrate-binding protein